MMDNRLLMRQGVNSRFLKDNFDFENLKSMIVNKRILIRN